MTSTKYNFINTFVKSTKVIVVLRTDLFSRIVSFHPSYPTDELLSTFLMSYPFKNAMRNKKNKTLFRE